MSGLRTPAPVLALELFPEERQQLLTLLAELGEADWQRPTACPGWSVKDIALHLLADDLNALTRLRDRFSPLSLGPDDDLVAAINDYNQLWVSAARRLSSPVLRDLLAWSSGQVHTYFASLDPFGSGGPVEWAGPEPAPNWLEIAREYTERWVHQQQIREAVDRRLLTEPRLFAPVIATFVRALPRTYAGTPAPAGTTVSLVVEGDAGGRWTIAPGPDLTWQLYEGLPAGVSTATARMSQDTAWRLFTRALSPAEAARRVLLVGDESLGRRILSTVAILA